MSEIRLLWQGVSPLSDVEVWHQPQEHSACKITLKSKEPTIIVGAGLAGLTCAKHLVDSGEEVLVLEASDGVGGRVRTDHVEGFFLDRGFQVFPDAYPEAGRTLDLGALDLKRFRPGALVHKDGRFHRLMDVFRHPFHTLSTATRPVGSLRDKVLIGRLRLQATGAGIELRDVQDQSTLAFLRDFGFSEAMIDDFFRPFYGGIFLERELSTSARMFAFTFTMFAKGFATLPAEGMQQIPDQLAGALPPGSLRLNCRVSSIDTESELPTVELASGESLQGAQVVVATDGGNAYRLTGRTGAEGPKWKSVTGIYFAAPKSPLNEAIIAINSDSSQLVNHLCVPSDVADGYAAEGMSLISISLLDSPENPDLEAEVVSELRNWFGDEVDAWDHLRTYRIPRALPILTPLARESQATRNFDIVNRTYICGDHCTSSSIEGAIISGRKVAEDILKRNRKAA